MRRGKGWHGGDREDRVGQSADAWRGRFAAGVHRIWGGRAKRSEAMLQLYEKIAPLSRNITHEEVGRTGAFLLSDMSDGISAEVLHVDGGYNVMGSPGRLLDNLAKA